MDSLDFTCEAAAEESPDEDGDQSHGLDEEDLCVLCCDEGQLSVIHSSSVRTIKCPRALEHGAADAKSLYGNQDSLQQGPGFTLIINHLKGSITLFEY